MMPREILKNIRQLGLRTNRIVTETLAGSTYEYEAGERTAKRSSRESLMNCPCRERE